MNSWIVRRSLLSWLKQIILTSTQVTRNEVAHAQYSAQVCHRKADAIIAAQTTISALVSDEMIIIESGLSLFLSVWSRLQFDCAELLQWLQAPKTHPVRRYSLNTEASRLNYVLKELPLVIVSLLDSNHTLYASMADALDSCVMGIDPSLFSHAWY